MLTARSNKSVPSNVQPHSPIAPVDLSSEDSLLSASGSECLTEFFTEAVQSEALRTRISFDADTTCHQIQYLNGTTEIRYRGTALKELLSTLYALDPTTTSDMGGLTLNVVTSMGKLDVNLVHLATVHGDEWIVRVRATNPVPVVLDSLGLEISELRHLRKALAENRGLVSIGTPHRLHLEDWHRAVCRELSSPEKSVISLVPRLLEELPRVSQTILPPGDRWDQKLWQLASQADADVIVLSDDGTHGYAPDQLGVLAERCLVVQILQTPGISSLGSRTPRSPHVHRVVMHHPVRRLCKACCEPHNNPSRAHYSFLDRALPTLSDGVNAWLSASHSTHFKKPGGCPQCHDTGYAGETSVVDSIGDSLTLKNVAERMDAYSLSNHRVEKLMDMARDGEVCLGEVRRLHCPDLPS